MLYFPEHRKKEKSLEASMMLKAKLVRITGNNLQLNPTNLNKCTNSKTEQIELGSVYLCRTS